MRPFVPSYAATLLDDVMPFWLRHGLDREHGGIITSLDRDGSMLDTDKSVWFQGRAGWMFATLYNTVEKRAEWLEAARSCVEFSRKHCFAPDGKMYFTVTREGQPLRMRRYVFSESFAAIANAAFAKATGDARAAEDAVKTFATYLRYSFTPGVMAPKFEPTRPTKGIGAHMIGIVTAQELRANLGDVTVSGRTCTEWIDYSIADIERDFMKPEHEAVMEIVGPTGEIIDHFDGRTLNPGHAIEAAWFIMHEGKLRGDRRLVRTGLDHPRLDVAARLGRGIRRPVLFPRSAGPAGAGILARHEILVAAQRGDHRHPAGLEAHRRREVRRAGTASSTTGAFKHFADPEFGEWYGYLHRDGSVSSRVKGTMYKGPFHLPRMLWYCSGLCRQGEGAYEVRHLPHGHRIHF